MLSVALHTLRARWITFVGTFVALSLGVGLIATMGLGLAATFDAPERGPERFATAKVVVMGADSVRVPTEHGEKSKRLDRAQPIPPAVAEGLRSVGRTVQDRSFPVRVDRGPSDVVGHPWATAAFAPYELTGGRGAKADNEVVVTGSWARIGQRLSTDRGQVTVVGTAADRGFENALFFADSAAAKLSPRIDAVVVEARASAVVGHVPPGLRVLTGEDRRMADADPRRDDEAMVAVNALLGTAAGVTGFVSVFVVASTFAFSVAQRRREFGLLRLAGATPRQIRRTVVREALAVGAVASAAGCMLSKWGAPLLAGWLVDQGTAPAWFRIGDATWPFHLAFWSGLLVAMCGVIAASWRAGRTPATQTLREASVDSGTMTRGRRAFGFALLVTGLGLLGFSLLADPGELLHRKTYTLRPMLLITAFALIAPVVVRPVTRLLTWPVSRLRGAGGMLVRENTSAGVRRTAAIAAPVLVTVALTGSLMGAVGTINEAKASELADQTTADYVLTAPAGSSFDQATRRRIESIPGVIASATAPSSVFVLEEGVALIRSDARAADPAGLAKVARLPVVAGDVRTLDDRSIVVNEEWEKHRVGERVEIRRADGSPVTLTIAAVLRTGTGSNGVYVTAVNAPAAAVDRIDVKAGAGTDRTAVGTALRRALDGSQGRVQTKAAWVAASYPSTSEHTRIGFLVVLGIALVYAGIALANTLVMATSERVRELAALRLAGATSRQVLRFVAAETLAVVGVGALLGLAVAGLNVLGIWGALAALGVWSWPVIPWTELATATGACAVIALAATVLPAALALRVRAVGVRE